MDTAARNKSAIRRSAGLKPGADLRYQSGFGSELATEALPGALPQGQNSPQKVPYGCMPSSLGTRSRRPGTPIAFGLYRLRPAVAHALSDRSRRRF